MSNEIPLYVVGLAKDEPANEIFTSKFGGLLEKAKNILPEIIEAKITVKQQNTEGSRTHYDVTSVITMPKNRFVYTESGWDVLKICDELCRKFEGEFTKHTDNRQRESIRKRGTS